MRARSASRSGGSRDCARRRGPEAALLGEQLGELRQKRGLTFRALSDETGMSLAYLSDLERALKVPSLTTLVRLAVALNCKVTKLVSPFDKAKSSRDAAEVTEYR